MLLQKKGSSNVSLSSAKNKQEFWFVFLIFGITIGISRMIDENASLIALSNSDSTQKSKRFFQVTEVIGAFTTGVFISMFRYNFSPYVLLVLNSFLFVCAQVLMFFISMSGLAHFVATSLSAYVAGAIFVLVGVIAHEDYGTNNLHKILGFQMTGAAIGIFVFDFLIFD